jgi:hypothetical protein
MKVIDMPKRVDGNEATRARIAHIMTHQLHGVAMSINLYEALVAHGKLDNRRSNRVEQKQYEAIVSRFRKTLDNFEEFIKEEVL